MNFDFSHLKATENSEYWSKIDSQVLKIINKKVVAYKREIELEMELKGVGHIDTGRALNYLYEDAPINYIAIRRVKINNNQRDFYCFKRTKTENVKNALNKKIPIIKTYDSHSGEFGTFVHRKFYPRVLKNLGYIIEKIGAEKYNLVDIKGDIDIILSNIPFYIN